MFEKKRMVTLVFAAVVGGTAVSANAAVWESGSYMLFGPGSYFVMETVPGFYLPTAITSSGGIVTGTIQSTGTSHAGAPTGAEGVLSYSIDSPWVFFGNTGMHFTVSPTTGYATSDNTATLDMSGWRVTWNGIPSINLGSGAWNNASAGWSGNVNGLAQITTTNNGTNYVLQYTATVPVGDPSGFGGVHYGLHLEGVCGFPEGGCIVPVPGAVWLFVPGLVGLFFTAGRKRKDVA